MGQYTREDVDQKITDLNTSKEGILKILSDKGVEIHDNSKLEEIPGYIDKLYKGQGIAEQVVVEVPYNYEGGTITVNTPSGYIGFVNCLVKIVIE